MLAKVPPKRNDGRTSFGKLGQYISRYDAGAELRQEFAPPELEAQARELAAGLDLSDRYNDPRAADYPGRTAALIHAQAQAVEPPREPGRSLSNARTLDQLQTLGSMETLHMPKRGKDHAKEGPETAPPGDAPALETNCLSLRTASAEMKAVADMNTRVKDPVYHVVISWREGEQPTNEQMFDAGREAMKAVGMEGHQYVFAAHRDTGNHHLHMMVNRVHPETEKAVYPERDFYKLDRCMREVELRQGWEHDKGPFAVIERDGRKVVDWASKDVNSREKLPAKARDMETNAGHESLFSYARGEPRKAVAELLKDPRTSWQDLHSALAKHGLELREKGQGLAIYDKANPEQTPIKASDVHQELGKGKLVKRLGEFQPAIRAIQVEEPAKTYTRHREPVRDQSKRDQAREERAQARQLLRTRYDDWRAGQIEARKLDRTAARLGERQQQKDLAAHHKTRREQIRRMDAPAAVKKALYSVAAMEAVQAREKLRAELDAKRKAERAERPQNFKDWTADRAQEGDQAAISQLRGWAYADRRKAKDMEKADQERAKQNGITAEVPDQRAEPMSPRRLALLDSLQYQVDRKTGDVHYQAASRHVFTDSGKRINFSAAGATDREALAAGLALARQKFGQQLTLTGSEQFKEEAIRVMVEKRMDVRLADPALEAKRRALEAARDLPKGQGKDQGENLTRGRQGPQKGPTPGKGGMER